MLLTMLWCNATQPATAATDSSVGIQYYNAGKYQDAEPYLRKAVLGSPKDATLHYYLANDLVYLQEREEAKHEYKRCLQESRGNCPCTNLAIQALRSFEVADAREEIAREIDDETQSAVKIKLRAADDMAKNTTDIGERSAQLILQRAQAAARAAQAEAHSNNTQIDTTPIIEAGKAQGDLVRREHADRASNARDLSNRQEAALQQSSIYLLEQLQQSPRNGFGLKAEGTGLYVRNYGAANSSDGDSDHPTPVTEFMADQDKLILTHNHRPDPLPLRATPQVLDVEHLPGDGRFATRLLHGKLLPANQQ